MKPRYGQSYSALQRIKKYVKENQKTLCWEWQGFINRWGYGRLTFKQKKILAHRLSYQTFIGQIPDGTLVLHRCDNPRCVNPAHLYLGNSFDNARDCIQRNRRRLGSKDPNAKLTEDAVKFIRKFGAPKHPEYGWKPLAIKFGVSESTIRQVVKGKQWRHVK